MKKPGYLLAALCCVLALPAAAQKFSAQEQPRPPSQQWDTRQSPPIQRIYVSPGASGSVGGSSSWQRYDGYGGAQVPRDYGESRSGTVIIDQSGGGVRQSIEYPNGAVYPRTSP